MKNIRLRKVLITLVSISLMLSLVSCKSENVSVESEPTVITSETTIETSAPAPTLIPEETTDDSLVELDPTPTEEPEVVNWEDTETISTAKVKIRIRGEASFDSEVIAEFEEGTEVTVIAVANNSIWVKIRVEDVEGFIIGRCLVDLIDETETTEPTPTTSDNVSETTEPVATNTPRAQATDTPAPTRSSSGSTTTAPRATNTPRPTNTNTPAPTRAVTHTREEWMQIQGVSQYTASDGHVVYGIFESTSSLDAQVNAYRTSNGWAPYECLGSTSSIRQAAIDSYSMSASCFHQGADNWTSGSVSTAYNNFYNSSGHRAEWEVAYTDATVGGETDDGRHFTVSMTSASIHYYEYIDDTTGFVGAGYSTVQYFPTNWF